MFIAMIVFGVIGVCVGLITIVVVILSRYTENVNGQPCHDKFSIAHKGFIVLAIAVTLLAVPAIFIGTKVVINNDFYTMYEEYQTAESRVIVMQEKQEVLGAQLKSLLEEYVDYEGGLIEALNARGENSDNLIALFEEYPDLLASENVKQVMEEYVSLTEDVVSARVGKYELGEYSRILLVHGSNEIAREYNTAARTLPRRWFMPDELPKELPLYSVE